MDKELFIKRLTDEQIRNFLEEQYPKKDRYSYSFDIWQDNIYVRIDHNFGDSSFNMSLFDYHTVGLSRPAIWIKYLYEIFGEEYKQAYLNECAKVFD